MNFLLTLWRIPYRQFWRLWLVFWHGARKHKGCKWWERDTHEYLDHARDHVLGYVFYHPITGNIDRDGTNQHILLNAAADCIFQAARDRRDGLTK